MSGCDSKLVSRDDLYKAQRQTTFIADVGMGGETETVTNPDTGITVPTIPKITKDLLDQGNAVIADIKDRGDAVIAASGFEVPVPYSAGLNIERLTQTVEYQDDVYHAINVPFVTSGTFEGGSHWQLLRGALKSDVYLPNLLRNHNFTDGAVANTSPQDFNPGDDVFLGWKALTAIVGGKYENGEWSRTSGSIYQDIPKSGALEFISLFTASIKSTTGPATEIGVTFSLVGDSYRIAIDASNVFSACFNEGGFAANHNASPTSIDYITKVLNGEVQFLKSGAIVGSNKVYAETSSSIKWIALSEEIDFTGKEVATIDEYTVVFTDGYSSPLLPPQVRNSKTVTYAMFGANPRGVIFPTTLNQSLGYGTEIVIDAEDSAPFIEACHEYCASYQYGGSIAQTKKDMGKTRAQILDDGNYVVNQTIKLNPFIKIESTSKGGWFSDGSGLGIYGNFTDKSNYLIDTAPMFTGGLRPLGGRYGRGDWENGNSAGCMNWQIIGVNARMLGSNVVKGILNRQLAMESIVTSCGIGDFSGLGNYEGICSSVCWGGEISSCNIKASFVPLLNVNDITIDDQHNNYLSVLGTPPALADYTPPPFPATSVENMTSCIINSYAEPHCYNNTCEGSQVGFKATNSNFQKGESNYYEKITKYIYAAHTVNCMFEPKYVFAANAELLWIEGSSVTSVSINLSSASFMQLSGWGNIGSGVKNVDIIGAINARRLPFNPRVNYTDIADNGVVTVYCDETGDDSASGFSEFNKIKTLQEAMYRAASFKEVLIEVSGSELLTKDASGIYSSFLENKDITINFNGATCSPGQDFNATHRMLIGNGSAIKLISAGNIDMSSSANTDSYRAFITCRDSVSVSIRGGSVTSDADAGRGYLIGSQFGNAAIINVTLNNFEIGTNSKLMYRPSAKECAWTQVGFGVTGTGTSGNANDGKIFSSTF